MDNGKREQVCRVNDVLVPFSTYQIFTHGFMCFVCVLLCGRMRVYECEPAFSLWD